MNIYLTRAVYDELLDTELLLSLTECKRSWGLAGVFYYDVEPDLARRAIEAGALEN